jgi:hypothetical protein
MIIFASFSRFSPVNVTVITCLLLFALSAACAIFLILQLSRPFTGLMMISSAPLRNSLAPYERGAEHMTIQADALLPTANEVRQRIALAEAEDAERQARARAQAEAEKKALIDQLRKPPGISEGEAVQR